MTVRMRAALVAATKQGGSLRRTFRDTAPWPAAPATLAALRRDGLMSRREGTNAKGHRFIEWTVTDAGREALKPPVRTYRERPLFLARMAGYTTSPARAILDAGEVLDGPSDHWSLESVARHARDVGRRARACAVRSHARAA